MNAVYEVPVCAHPSGYYGQFLAQEHNGRFVEGPDGRFEAIEDYVAWLEREGHTVREALDLDKRIEGQDGRTVYALRPRGSQGEEEPESFVLLSLRDES